MEMKYESTFNAIDAILRNEAGCSNELDYIEQTSWLLFLKYLDDAKTGESPVGYWVLISFMVWSVGVIYCQYLVCKYEYKSG